MTKYFFVPDWETCKHTIDSLGLVNWNAETQKEVEEVKTTFEKAKQHFELYGIIDFFTDDFPIEKDIVIQNTSHVSKKI